MTPQDELTARQLAEARARARGAALRRALVLFAAAFVVLALGAKGNDTPLAIAFAAVLIVVGIMVLIRVDRT